MIEVAMQLGTLDGEPARFGSAYTLRGFLPGDDATWLELQQSTGIYGQLDPDLFVRQFGLAPHGRQFFVIDGSLAVATGTAWYGVPLRGERWGRLHWVAVRPSHQRRGLGLQLCRHLLAVLREFGHAAAFLTTGSENWPAITLYRRLGFTPWIRTTEEAAFWAAQEGQQKGV